MIFLPYLIAFLLGFTLLQLVLKKDTAPLPLRLFLAAGLGLGATAQLNFLMLAAWQGVNKNIWIVFHLLLVVLLASLSRRGWLEDLKSACSRRWKARDILTPLILAATLIPLTRQAQNYPQGGWDAWQVWNFKAKFLLLSGGDWRQMLDPALWRSSPHYPLLLPLMNVWGWLFAPLDPAVPMATSVLFTFLTAGLLWSALRDRDHHPAALLAPLLLLTWPYFALFSTSQYCDVVVGYYLLAALVAFLQAQDGKTSFAFLAGIFTGILTFTKPEGMVAGLLVLILGAVILVWQEKTIRSRRLILFLQGAFLSALPTILFHILCSPGNQTFINGLTSTTKPATLERLQFILAYIGLDLVNGKWHGSWILLAAGVIFAGRRCWNKRFLILPLFLGGYLGIILLYYFLNTYFRIEWWLQVSLERILFSLLPVMILWAFSGWLSTEPPGKTSS